MRVELLGPSGVGKTAVLSMAQSHRASEHEWMGPKETDAYLQQVARLRSTDNERGKRDNVFLHFEDALCFGAALLGTTPTGGANE